MDISGMLTTMLVLFCDILFISAFISVGWLAKKELKERGSLIFLANRMSKRKQYCSNCAHKVGSNNSDTSRVVLCDDWLCGNAVKVDVDGVQGKISIYKQKCDSVRGTRKCKWKSK